MRLDGKVALVTGAAQGIGRAIALRLAEDGADVALIDLKEEKLGHVAAQVQSAGRRATTFRADVSQREAVLAAVDHTARELGGLDVMVNNAGIAPVGTLDEATPEMFERLMNINLAGVLWGIQAAAAKFRALGRRGKIINASSVAGYEGFAMLGVYSATKFAIRGLTQAAAQELAPDGITVNAYCPGPVGTDMWDEIDRRMAEITGQERGFHTQRLLSRVALGRVVTSEEVAGVVSFLAGPDADFITGQSVMIDGGLVYR